MTERWVRSIKEGCLSKPDLVRGELATVRAGRVLGTSSSRTQPPRQTTLCSSPPPLRVSPCPPLRSADPALRLRLPRAPEVIRERSVAGTNRVAQAGAWLGGIVPHGYRKLGQKQNAHIVVSEDPIPGLAMSEAEVIREVFRMAAVGLRQRRSSRDRSK